jgi:hypothetical protein
MWTGEFILIFEKRILFLEKNCCINCGKVEGRSLSSVIKLRVLFKVCLIMKMTGSR